MAIRDRLVPGAIARTFVSAAPSFASVAPSFASKAPSFAPARSVAPVPSEATASIGTSTMPPPGATPRPTPALWDRGSIGLTRQQVIDELVGLPGSTLSFGPETIAKDGSVSVIGRAELFSDMSSALSISLVGPADDLHSVLVLDYAIDSVKAAAVELAILGMLDPEGPDWAARLIEDGGTGGKTSYGSVFVVLSRDFLWLDGVHLSTLTLTSEPYPVDVP